LISTSYDEPAIRSEYSIEIQHDASYMAVSNMPQASRLPVSGGNYVITKFEEIESIQSYLIAFTVSDFLFVQDTTGRIPQRVFAKPQSISSGYGQLALNVSGKILEGFENYLDTPFSLPKMDQAALPNFAAGAMENWVSL
jgi:aminopeptidase N